MNKLREIISGEHDEEEKHVVPKTNDQVADEYSDSKPSPPENKSQEKLNDCGDSAMTSSGSTSIPQSLPSAGATSEAAHAPASGMNKQLWELEETRPTGAGKNRPAGDCDPSRPPSEDNQVRMLVQRPMCWVKFPHCTFFMLFLLVCDHGALARVVSDQY